LIDLHSRSSAFICILVLSVALLACDLGQAVTPAPIQPPPTVLPTAAPTPTRASTSSAPAWWPAALAQPMGAEFVGDSTRTVWSTSDLNVPGLKDFFLGEAKAAGYKTYSVTLSEGSIYDLYFLNGAAAYGLNLTQGSNATFLTGNRVGIFHVKATGAANLDIDLPMRSHLDTTPGSEVAIGTSVPSPECGDCQYYINVHIAPFKGIGAYDSKPGIYIIDVELIPGGRTDQQDYRWAQSCTVMVQDASTGSYDCRGLQNVNDQSIKLDVSGGWRQP
jgi:hypothetical protein